VISHPSGYCEKLPAADTKAILEASIAILERAGMEVRSERARIFLQEAGARIEPDNALVRFSESLVRQSLAQAPPSFVLRARNPEKNVTLGGRALATSPGYGSASVCGADGRRRPATASDFDDFARLACACDEIDITGGLLVEPSDIPPAERPRELTFRLISLSDKPFFGSVAGAEGARNSLELARIAMGPLDTPHMLALININSPLVLDGRMAEALVAYAEAGQAILLTPGILMGITAPVTLAGALAQAFAEQLACLALAQAVRPGVPVILGTGGFGSDMRTGGSGFGRPENALGTLCGAQIARSLGLPFRCSGGVTGSMLADARAGSESTMTALAAWSGGANLCLQAAGTLDNINAMSREKFLMDAEIWSSIQRMGRTDAAGAEEIALEEILSRPESYITADHTLEHYRQSIHTPRLARAETYESWLAAGGRDHAALARESLGQAPGRPAQPLDERARAEMERCIRAGRGAPSLG
jgi:trimethylamine--corrinoid protein Co-methyltransferase